jgi:hypothetical protein
VTLSIRNPEADARGIDLREASAPRDVLAYAAEEPGIGCRA